MKFLDSTKPRRKSGGSPTIALSMAPGKASWEGIEKLGGTEWDLTGLGTLGTAYTRTEHNKTVIVS